MQGTQSISLYMVIIILTCARCWLVSPLIACCWSSLTCFIFAERSGARSGHQPPAWACLCRQADSRSWLAEGGSSSATTCHNMLIEPLEPLLEPLLEQLQCPLHLEPLVIAPGHDGGLQGAEAGQEQRGGLLHSRHLLSSLFLLSSPRLCDVVTGCGAQLPPTQVTITAAWVTSSSYRHMGTVALDTSGGVDMGQVWAPGRDYKRPNVTFLCH